MILTQTPLRVSFVGGGTDLPSFYRECGGGEVVSAAIDLSVTVMARARSAAFGCRSRVALSTGDVFEGESLDSVDDPIVRAAARIARVDGPVEIVSFADAPPGTGLGSSSSFSVGLLHALHVLAGRSARPEALAEEACRLEIDMLGRPVGRQDQTIAAFGGLRHIVFHPDDTVSVEDAPCSEQTRRALTSSLLLFYLGGQRPSGAILSGIAMDSARRERLSGLRSLCRDFLRALARGSRLDEIGEILDAGWQLKRGLASGISTDSIDDIYQRSRRAGAVGGKLLGAGGAGFLLLYADSSRREAVLRALSGFIEIPLRIDAEGSRVIHAPARGRARSL